MRLGAILAWFLLLIPAHLLLSRARRRSLLPPLFLAVVGRLAGLRVRTRGHPASGRLLLLANHVSWLDILALAGETRAAFVAKGSLADNPALHWLCAQNDTVFIAREQRVTVAAQVGQLTAALARRRLVVFPEGTTGDGRSLHPFKSALLSAVERADSAGGELQVQPVALDYANAPQIAWVGDEPGLHNVLRVLARLAPVRLTIRFCDPLHGAQLADRKTMAGAAQEAIRHALRL